MNAKRIAGLIGCFICLACMVLTQATPASADTIEWANDVDGSFSNGTNWIGGIAPGTADSAKFFVPGTTPTDPYTVTFGSDVTNLNLYVGDNTVTFTGTGVTRTYALTTGTTGGAEVKITTGSLTLASDMKMTVDGNMSVGSDSDKGTLNVNAGAVVEASGSIINQGLSGEGNESLIVMGGAGASLSACDVTNSGTIRGEGQIINGMVDNNGLVWAETGTLEVDMIMNNSGATIEINNLATFKINQFLDMGNFGSIILHGGTFDIVPAAFMSEGTISGHGTYNGGGNMGTLYNNPGALIDINGGDMTFNVNVTNDGVVNVSDGCTATFLHHVYGSMGSFTGGNGTCKFLGTFHSGSSPGLATFAGNVELAGAVEMELNGTTRGTDYDAIDVVGTLTLGGTLEVVLYEYSPGQFYNPQLGESFDLFNWGTLIGTFDTPLDLPGLDAGLSWDIDKLYTDGTITVVPEPASAVLLLSGGVLAIFRRRKKS